MAQYCYYNSNTLIRKVSFNGNTYRKINYNGTVFTISTWYSASCKNATCYESTYSTSNTPITKVTDGYSHKVTELDYSYRNGSWYSYKAAVYTTWYLDSVSDGVYGYWNSSHLSQHAGYGQYGYMSVSFYFGSESYRTHYSVTPPPGTKMYLVTHNEGGQRVSYYKSRSLKSDINFSYSTTSIANSTAFNASNFAQYYNIYNHSKNSFTTYANYTISRNLQGHHFIGLITTTTF